jgi:hypothetical protein
MFRPKWPPVVNENYVRNTYKYTEKKARNVWIRREPVSETERKLNGKLYILDLEDVDFWNIHWICTKFLYWHTPLRTRK